MRKYGRKVGCGKKENAAGNVKRLDKKLGEYLRVIKS